MALDFVNGPADGVSTDNALVRWDGATGRLVQNSGTTLSDAGAMAFPVGGSVSLFNVAGANSESFRASFSANVMELVTETGGTGTLRALRVGTNTNNLVFSATTGTFNFAGAAGGFSSLGTSTAAASLRLRGNLTTTTGQGCVELTNANSLSAAANTQVVASVVGTLNQSGTAGYKGLLVSLTETATGSGQKDLASFEVGGSQRNRIGQNGNVYASMQTAIPAGGAANTGYFFSSTAGFGVYYGSGAPSVSAAKGSLYLRSDGSGVNDRAYINTDGGTTWTALVTVA